MLTTNNHLLTQLSPDDQALLEPLAQEVELKQGHVLYEPLQLVEYVHFFNGGMSSEIAINRDGHQIEVGCIGHEGFSANFAVLGVDRTPHRSFMQAGTTALRFPAADLRRAMRESETLSSLLLRFTHVFMIQVAATTLADGRYKIEQRLARWLLMSQDRLGPELPLTHDFLGLMLGVRRPSVTDALHVLEGERAISTERALIKIRNRSKLEAFARDAYGAPEAEYRRLISPDWPRS